MANIILKKSLDVEDKLALMREDARFEVIGDADAEATALSCAADIPGLSAPPKVPKMFMASKCLFNCAYCACRCSREDREGYCNTPMETARLALATAQRSRTGVFISSAIYRNADYTQELLSESARLLRTSLGYKGYLHVKVMPGADAGLIARTGQYASRMSVNIEVAHSEGYSRIAKQKNRGNILTPMGEIARQIRAAKQETRAFATSQTTQLMAGSIGEDDRVIMNLSHALYNKYGLSRVYYTAFHYQQPARGYEMEDLPFKQTPYWRMARLYQADRLLQLYGFSAEDVTPAEDPFLHEEIDPKAAWALRHRELYPVEVNTADYEELIRVPGIGITSAKRILEARRHTTLTHDLLRRMHVSLKHSGIFITCAGHYQGRDLLDSLRLHTVLSHPGEQLSIFSCLAEGVTGCE